MKPSAIVRASCVAFALLALSAGGAAAASFKIGTAPGTTEADCTAQGGTVATDASGAKICKLKPGGPTQSREPSN